MPKAIAVKCGICLNFHGAFRTHCPYCGSYKVIEDKKRSYFSWHNGFWTEIVRGVPLPLDSIIDRVVTKAKTKEEIDALVLERQKKNVNIQIRAKIVPRKNETFLSLNLD